MQQSNYGDDGRAEHLTVAVAMGDAGRRQGRSKNLTIKQIKNKADCQGQWLIFCCYKVNVLWLHLLLKSPRNQAKSSTGVGHFGQKSTPIDGVVGHFGQKSTPIDGVVGHFGQKSTPIDGVGHFCQKSTRRSVYLNIPSLLPKHPPPHLRRRHLLNKIRHTQSQHGREPPATGSQPLL